jgi:hypothetical protein
MPRGQPKVLTALRLDPKLIEEVQRYAGPRNFTAAVEDGLALWLKQARRKAPKHLAPPIPRELATRGTPP